MINIEYSEVIVEYKLPGITTFSCERGNNIGGGIALYSHSPLDPNSVNSEIVTNMDIVYIDIKDNFNKVIIGLIYRSPE